jgi:hypothetical protein
VKQTVRHPSGKGEASQTTAAEPHPTNEDHQSINSVELLCACVVYSDSGQLEHRLPGIWVLGPRPGLRRSRWASDS